MLAAETASRRRVAHCAEVAEGESLGSWVDRTAAGLDLQRRDAWLHLGLISRSQATPVAYGADLDGQARRALAAATALPDEVIARMLLRRYDGGGLHFDS